MESLHAVPIIVGVVGALVGVYFRESFRRAVRQKMLASKLEAQMHEIISTLLRSKSVDALAVGEVWRKEAVEALMQGGAKGLAAVEQKWETRLKEAKKQVERGEKEIDEDLHELYDSYRGMPERLFSYHLQQLEIVRDSLFSSRELISDDEAAEISWDTVSLIVSVRELSIRAIHLNALLILMLREMKELDLDAVRPLLFDVAELSVRLSRNLLPLRMRAANIRNKSLVRLTIENLLGRH